MGIHITRALKARDSLVSRIRDAYSTARICHFSSAQLNDAIGKAFAALPKGTPAWVAEYGRGYRAALDAQLYSDSLVFGGYVQGVFYSTHRDRADYYESNGISPADYADDGRVTARGHYWRDNTAKPFFVG